MRILTNLTSTLIAQSLDIPPQDVHAVFVIQRSPHHPISTTQTAGLKAHSSSCNPVSIVIVVVILV
ncbi:hypothetical protein E4U33_000563, partial [Claviceps sp. LM78 group G4]